MEFAGGVGTTGAEAVAPPHPVAKNAAIANSAKAQDARHAA